MATNKNSGKYKFQFFSSETVKSELKVFHEYHDGFSNDIDLNNASYHKEIYISFVAMIFLSRLYL